MSRSGILLLAHGSKDPNWRLPFEAVRKETGRQSGAPVSLAYLEAAAPDFAAGVAELAAQGVERIRIVPLFLAAGSHVRVDLPRLVDAARSAHPAIAFQLAPAAGESAIVQQAVAAFASGAGDIDSTARSGAE